MNELVRQIIVKFGTGYSIENATSAVFNKYQKVLEKLFKQPVRYESNRSDDYRVHKIVVKITEKDYNTNKMVEVDLTVANWSIDQLNGCCGMVTFYHVYVTNKFRRKGIGQLLLKMREEVAVLAGYTAAIATSVTENVSENHILEKNGWTKLYTFQNRRTGNQVFQWIKLLAPLHDVVEQIKVNTYGDIGYTLKPLPDDLVDVPSDNTNTSKDTITIPFNF